MNLKEALDALLSGREIPPDAREQLTNFDPESLREELSTLKVRFEEQENAKLTAEELLKKQLEKALSEKEELQQQHEVLERNALIRELAACSGCEEPDYLDFLARKENVDLKDQQSAEAFLARTIRNRPNFFRASLHPGSGPGSCGESASLLPRAERSDRISRILNSLDSAPVIQ